MSSRLHIDLSGLTTAVIDSAPPDEEVCEGTAAAHASICGRRKSREIGFFDLPLEHSHLASCERVLARVTAPVERLVVLGMGGSSLGAQALVAALSDGAIPIVFIDNSDPHSIARVIAESPAQTTLWNAVTKSGGTSETCAQLLAVLAALESTLGSRQRALARIVVTTDPEDGVLRTLAAKLSLATLEVPRNVGGRFSVFSSVGLFPALVAAIDIRALLAGAARMAKRVLKYSDPFRNPALMFARLATWHLEAGRPVHVFWAYADRLERTGAWFQQLWAESLGKRRGDGTAIGPTPVVARGASDQHSMLQLFADGPDDKLHLFVAPRKRTALPLSAATALGSGPGFDYLAGRDVAELIDAQLEGTRGTLAVSGRPTAAITLERVDADSLGELIMFFEAATAFAGPMLGVDPFDQPGVEAAKVAAFAALGRRGYEGRAPQRVTTDDRYVF